METRLDAAVAWILERCGEQLTVATPLGLGKPNPLLNALYRAIAADPKRRLHLFTALSLARPIPKPGLESRFLQPFLDRQFGADYPELDYVTARRANALPPNIEVTEFYLQSGVWLHNEGAQCDYASINYTHVARDVAARHPNLIVQLVARRGDRLSLSCNPDTILDLLDRMAAEGEPRPLVVLVVHPDLPYLGNDAEVPLDFADLVLEEPGPAHRLFALPREPIIPTEHAIGLHASTWVKDGGTLQIGIGALSDSIVNALTWRQHDPDLFGEQIARLDAPCAGPESGRFHQGLYGASEMVMDGFMHLRRNGILKRRVYDHLPLQQLLNEGLVGEVADDTTLDRLIERGLVPMALDRPTLEWLQYFGWADESIRLHDGELHWPEGHKTTNDLSHDVTRAALRAHIDGRRLRHGRYLHGGFWLGSSELQNWLRELDGEDFSGIAMTRISHINQLYGGREALDIAQRHHARFFNTCMMQTVFGAAVSDGLADGQVVSGVGGQYNFVAMAHAIPNGRSILLLRATRESGGRTVSNIVYNYGHATIPRHLRDIVVTEYGSADLRGQTDAECIRRMLAITDARFQDDLLRQAKGHGKIERNFQIPERWRANTPEQLRSQLKIAETAGRLGVFPFGSDLTDDELKLGRALKFLKAETATTGGRLSTVAKAMLGSHQPDPKYLARMGLTQPSNREERLFARLVGFALSRIG
ncbi:MAG: acetyl-CoA hydrolase [Ahniella sp.]|nr:acetyl-CoA hydrolase [Ahniella sp.]